jgi:hypothetical protein
LQVGGLLHLVTEAGRGGPDEFQALRVFAGKDDRLVGLRGEREDRQTQANGRKEEDSYFHEVPVR